MLSSVKCNQIRLQQFGIDVSTEAIDFLAKVLRMHEFQTIYYEMIDVTRNLRDEERYSDCLTSKGLYFIKVSTVIFLMQLNFVSVHLQLVLLASHDMKLMPCFQMI